MPAVAIYCLPIGEHQILDIPRPSHVLSRFPEAGERRWEFPSRIRVTIRIM